MIYLSLIMSCCLFSLVLIGWGFFFSKILKSELSIGLFNATAFCALAAFMGFIMFIPQLMAFILIGLGGVFMISSLIYECTLPNKSSLLKRSGIFLPVFLISITICIIFDYGMKFRSIDDYSFWGVMSKYLFVFDALPDNDNYINARFLTYTPVLASFHYILYTLSRQYAQFLGYFAQGFVFISAMLVLLDVKNGARTIINLSLMVILFSLAYGSVLGRMEVDAYVAAYFFIVTWVIYTKGAEALSLVFIPLLFLSVIKEIGLLFSLFSLLLYIVLQKPKGTLRAQCLILFLSILSIKLIWIMHVAQYGFQNFSSAVSLKTAMNALNPFNEYFHPVQFLYLKEIFFSAFDRVIRVPYIVVYLAIAGLWHYLVRSQPQTKDRINKTMGLFVLLSIIYLLMLYFLQAIVFGVGHVNAKILDFPRYYNMLFLPWFAMIIFISFNTLKPELSLISNKAAVLSLMIALAFFVGGKIERTKKFYQPNNLYTLYSVVAEHTSVLPNKHWSLCLNNPPEPAYDVTMPLRYLLMPNRVLYQTNTEAKIDCDLDLSWEKKELVFHRNDTQRLS